MEPLKTEGITLHLVSLMIQLMMTRSMATTHMEPAVTDILDKLDMELESYRTLDKYKTTTATDVPQTRLQQILYDMESLRAIDMEYIGSTICPPIKYRVRTPINTASSYHDYQKRISLDKKVKRQKDNDELLVAIAAKMLRKVLNDKAKKKSKTVKTVWEYDPFGGGVWGRKKRSNADYYGNLEFDYDYTSI